MNVIETFGLGVRYGKSWAVRDCTLEIPEGHIVALVGSNGAGKTTLLHCAVGLTAPTSGAITVLDGIQAGALDALERVAFVAQDAPLYAHLSVREMLEVAENLNRRFDRSLATTRLSALDISLRHKVGKLSGGQQAQLALTLALARRPELLILDEPLARLDPVARHDVMALVMSIAAEEGLSVVFSSHVVSELERVADYLILMSHGRVQMTGEIDELVARHAVVSGPTESAEHVAEQFCVVNAQQAARRTQFLVRADRPIEVPSAGKSTMFRSTSLCSPISASRHSRRWVVRLPSRRRAPARRRRDDDGRTNSVREGGAGIRNADSAGDASREWCGSSTAEVRSPSSSPSLRSRSRSSSKQAPCIRATSATSRTVVSLAPSTCRVALCQCSDQRFVSVQRADGRGCASAWCSSACSLGHHLSRGRRWIQERTGSLGPRESVAHVSCLHRSLSWQLSSLPLPLCSDCCLAVVRAPFEVINGAVANRSGKEGSSGQRGGCSAYGRSLRCCSGRCSAR